MTILDKQSRDRAVQIWTSENSSSETTSPAPAAAARARARSYLIACALLVSGCRTDSAPTSDARTTIDAATCGAVPSRPSMNVAFDGQGNATMTVQTYQAIEKWMNDAEAWIRCRQMNP